MPTLRKLLNREIDNMSMGELSEALIQATEQLNDFVGLYEREYARSDQLQKRIDRLKNAQRCAQMEFRGFVE